MLQTNYNVFFSHSPFGNRWSWVQSGANYKKTNSFTAINYNNADEISDNLKKIYFVIGV